MAKNFSNSEYAKEHKRKEGWSLKSEQIEGVKQKGSVDKVKLLAEIREHDARLAKHNALKKKAKGK